MLILCRLQRAQTGPDPKKSWDDKRCLASSRLTPVFSELLLYYWLIVMPTQKWLNSNNLDWRVSGLCRSRAERTHIHLPSDRIKNICFSQMWLVEPEKSGGGKWKMQKPESRRLKQHHKVEGGAQKLWFNILSSSETSGKECAYSAGHMMESGSAFSSDSISYSCSPSDHSNLLPLTPFRHKELWVGFSVGKLHLSIAPIFSNIITLILEAFRHMCSWT